MIWIRYCRETWEDGWCKIIIVPLFKGLRTAKLKKMKHKSAAPCVLAPDIILQKLPMKAGGVALQMKAALGPSGDR